MTYFKTTVKEFFGYTPNHYKITIDGNLIETKAFLITVANAGQWGNDVYIAPEAELSDGILNVSILKPFSLFAIPMIGVKLFSKKYIPLSNYNPKKENRLTLNLTGSYLFILMENQLKYPINSPLKLCPWL